VSVSRIGRRPEARQVALAAGPLTLDVTLREARVELAPVQVTASPAATRAQDSPQPVAVLAGAALRTAQGAALGETLAEVPGVRSLSMTTGIGKPVIRGMTHYRVVTLDNGQRSETQSWGHDHSPNVETAAAERVEVIKGPASVLYGSDALGGVVNVVAPPVPDALGAAPFARGRAATAYHHNVRGADGTVTVEGAAGGFGARAALTARRSGDMRTPTGPLGNTTNRATAAELAAGTRGAWGTVSARYAGRDERVEIFDDPAESPGYTGFQRIATHRATAEATLPAGGARVVLNGGYEQNLRREFADAGARSPDLGLFVRNWTGFAHLHHAPVRTPFGPAAGTLGASAMASDFANRGSETLIPDSRTRTGALYAFEQGEWGRWRATAGARYDWRTLATGGDAGHRRPGAAARLRRGDRQRRAPLPRARAGGARGQRGARLPRPGRARPVGQRLPRGDARLRARRPGAPGRDVAQHRARRARERGRAHRRAHRASPRASATTSTCARSAPAGARSTRCRSRRATPGWRAPRGGWRTGRRRRSRSSSRATTCAARTPRPACRSPSSRRCAWCTACGSTATGGPAR
jgi:outer membrane receptor protein involved in Fe transport